MSSPVTPDQIHATLPDPNASICGNFISSLIRFPTLIYEWFAWAFDSSGNGSKALINQTLPSGSITMAACLLSEDGTRLLCDGREVSRDAYADLFAAIGTSYGTPSGSSVFKIPNLAAKFPVGIGSFDTAGTVAIGVPGGEDKHLLTAAESGLPAHTHDLTSYTLIAGSNFNAGGNNDRGGSVTGGVHGGAQPASQAHANIPPYLGLYFYIIT